MKRQTATLLAGLALAALTTGSAFGATLMLRDSANVIGSGTGVTRNSGWSRGITTSATRLEGELGLLRPTLHYWRQEGSRGAAAYWLTNTTGGDASTGKLYTRLANNGVVSYSTNGTSIYDIGPHLKTHLANADVPAVYELNVDIADLTTFAPDGSTATAPVCFGLSSVTGLRSTWDFGFEVYRATTNDSSYVIARRMSENASGVQGGLVRPVTNNAGAFGQEFLFRLKITDAGSETTPTGVTKIQLSVVEGGTTNLIYDTSTDPDLVGTGFKFFRSPRYIYFQMPNDSGPVTYDNIDLNWVSGPTHEPEIVTWTGGGADDNWSTGLNWSSGMAPGYLDYLLFSGTTRQVNINDLTSPAAAWLTLSNAGFDLTGNALKIRETVTNYGNNVISLPLNFLDSPLKRWSVAPGSELTLGGPVTASVNGWHYLSGGGTLRVTDSFRIPTEPYDPVFVVQEGPLVVDGATALFETIGGVRIGSLSTASTAAEMILTNGATYQQWTAGGNLRVGDSASTLTSRIIIDNSSLLMDGGTLGLPWVTNALAEVSQNGGIVSGCVLSFNEEGYGQGVYNLHNGTLEVSQIRNRRLGMGTTSIHFDNALVRTKLAVATGDFFSGVGVAEIQSGGLTLDITDNDVTVSQSFSGSGSLTKAGGLNATLKGINTYAGDTMVVQGKLVLPNTQTNGGSIQVASGAGFGVIRTAQEASLTAASLSMADSSPTIDIDMTTFGTPAAPIVDVGTLSLSGTVTLNFLGGNFLSPGRIVLFKFTTLSGAPSFMKGTFPATLAGDIEVDSDSVDLVITSSLSGLRWSGVNGPAWDLSTLNWVNTFDNVPFAYLDGYATEFLDGAATNVVDVAAAGTTLNPGSLTISNDAAPYVFLGGSISIPIATKSGTNELIRVDGSDSIGQIKLEAGSLVISNTADMTFSSAVVSTNPETKFVKQGQGVLTAGTGLSAADSLIEVKQGVYKLGSSTGSLGSTNGSTKILPGASLDVANLAARHEPVIVSGTGFSGRGAIYNSVADNAGDNLTDVEMLGDTAFGATVASARFDIRAYDATGPVPGLRGNGFKLTKVGPGNVIVACDRTVTNAPSADWHWDLNLGDITVSEGWLSFEENLKLGNPANKIVVMPNTANARTILNLRNLGLANPVVRSIYITNAQIESAGGNASTTNQIDSSIFMDGQVGLGVLRAVTILNGTMSGNASLNIYTFGAAANGRVFLNGANTFTGNTTVTNGTLAGHGSIAGNLVMLGGTLAPGFHVGTFTVGGNATLGGTTTMELNPGQTPNCDKLVVNGTITPGGTLTVALAPGATAPQVGDTFVLFNQGVTFAAAPTLPALAAGLGWDTSALATAGTIRVVSTVPPSVVTVSVTGGTFTFSGTGGTPGDTYYVLTSSDVSLPMSAWVPVETNVFQAGGTFTFSTNISTTTPQAFFGLQVP